MSTCMHADCSSGGTRKMGRIGSLISGVEIRGVHVHPRDSEMKFYFITASTPLRHSVMAECARDQMKFHFTTMPPKEKKKALDWRSGYVRPVSGRMVGPLACSLTGAGTLGTPFVSPTGLYVRAGTPQQDVCRQKWAGVLDSAGPALGKSEAGATRPQLLGSTQLAHVRVDVKPDSRTTERTPRRQHRPGPGVIDERRRKVQTPVSLWGAAPETAWVEARGTSWEARNGRARIARRRATPPDAGVAAKDKEKEGRGTTTLIRSHLGKVKGRLSWVGDGGSTKRHEYDSFWVWSPGTGTGTGEEKYVLDNDVGRSGRCHLMNARPHKLSRPFRMGLALGTTAIGTRGP
ncbi:hypothetical protein EDB85DRAFT_2279517 [Lactarius pseudohatsudake]|nr:hypothetical protein EDB85DRAFT_2279517 [Lactarius pseudohatsudake]